MAFASSRQKWPNYLTTKAPEINILVLGETGVGKSTFINGFANYLTYKTLEEAELNELISLIPTKFYVTNDNYKVQAVTCGQDDNEDIAKGQSATQSCRCYVFPFGEYLIRIIDTPGIGDVRGIEQDKKNIDNIMSFLSEFDDLHAICFLLKPNNARLTVEFQFCLKELFCQLSKSASQNIVFVFTHSRSTFYKPGESMPLLEEVLENISKNPPHVNIELNKNTIFCLDNEAFRFLVAMRNGIRFTEHQKRDFSSSWHHSFEECMRLINRVIGDQHQPGLTPHKVKDTLSVNEARQAIINLSQPLAEISQNIQDNLKVLEQRKQEVKDNSGNIEVLKTKLYVPELDLIIKHLDHPATICAHRDCARSYQVAGMSKWHYEQRCHPHCYLNDVPKEIFGDPSLKECAAMDSSGVCKKCNHNYTIHMHVYYESEVTENKTEDYNIKQQINDKESAKRAAEETIVNVEKRRTTLEMEQDIITKAMAKFGYFLKTNAIAPYNDSFKDYLKHLIENEKSLLWKGMNNFEKVAGLKRLLKEYDEEVRVLNLAMNSNMPNASSHIDSDEVFKIIQRLFDLELTGKKIKQLYQTIKNARKQENYNHRQVHYTPKNVINRVAKNIVKTAKNIFTGDTNARQTNQKTQVVNQRQINHQAHVVYHDVNYQQARPTCFQDNWHGQIPFPTQQLKYTYDLPQIPSEVVTQDWDVFSQPFCYEEANEESDDNNDEANGNGEKDDGMRQENDVNRNDASGNEQREVDVLKKKMEETEKRMANMETLLQKLVANLTNK